VIKELRLKNFKSFKDATLKLGPFTVLVGTNASGKSNLRDAFRFLHGVGRGYTLAEIFGEKYGEGGERVWAGIRGGLREAVFQNEATFHVDVSVKVMYAGSPSSYEFRYEIEVEPGAERGPRVVAERAHAPERRLFEAQLAPPRHGGAAGRGLVTRIWEPHGRGIEEAFSPGRPALGQVRERIRDGKTGGAGAASWARRLMEALASMRFMEPDPNAMRVPSFPGETTLGDRGEGLSSVLHWICQDERRKRVLVSWLEELTPADVKGLEFPPDQIGRILVTLIEGAREKTSAYGASDGTLRFLAWLAAMFGPDSSRFYFAEELESAIHPARLSLLVRLIEQSVKGGRIQVAATTHSPQLLGLLGRESLAASSLVYRLPGHRESGVVPLLEVPTAREVLERQSIIALQESGWFENVMFFSQPDEDEPPAPQRTEHTDGCEPRAKGEAAA